jgi:signal transduction histidine kinase
VDARRRWFAAAAALLAAGEIFIDVVTLIPFNAAIVYGLPVALAGFARDRRLLWGLTALLVAATFAVYAVQIPPGVFTLTEPLFINRVLAAAGVLLTAALVHRVVDGVAALEARAREDREANERKTRLLASVSHDIHTPLTAINLIADMIRSLAGKPGADIADLARNLQASANALTNLVADVLDASALNSGRVQLHETDFPLDELMVEEHGQLAAAAEAKGLRLELDEASPPLWLHADRVKLARSIRNLINNAIKFTAAGRIELAWSVSPEGDALIRVRDTGHGIAPQDLDRLFVEFSRFDAPIGEQQEGWGLGLAICRRLVGLMGGSIAVDSRLGVGSTFTVRLPRARVLRMNKARSNED